jgi:two-component system, OmpR family, response regulator ChvI
MKEHRLAILKEEFIDDQPDITLTIEVELEEEGLFDVDTFTDPEMALSSFKPGIYPLVILDIVMPKMDGFELYDTDYSFENQ